MTSLYETRKHSATKQTSMHRSSTVRFISVPILFKDKFEKILSDSYLFIVKEITEFLNFFCKAIKPRLAYKKSLIIVPGYEEVWTIFYNKFLIL